MSVYNSSKFMGPIWSRDRGYHHPDPLSDHIMRILLEPKKEQPPARNAALKRMLSPKDEK